MLNKTILSMPDFIADADFLAEAEGLDPFVLQLWRQDGNQ